MAPIFKMSLFLELVYVTSERKSSSLHFTKFISGMFKTLTESSSLSEF